MPPDMQTPLAMHTPCQACPLLCMPPAMHAPLPHMPPAMHAPCHACLPHHAHLPSPAMHAPPPDRRNDTHLLKHYLSATTVADGKNRHWWLSPISSQNFLLILSTHPPLNLNPNYVDIVMVCLLEIPYYPRNGMFVERTRMKTTWQT